MARSGAIEIPIAADTSGIDKSISHGLIEPLEDAQKALDKLSETDAGDDIYTAMWKAQDATEDLSKQLDETRADLKKLGYAARDAGDDGKAGMHGIKRATQEVTQEMGQNLGEAVSSIRGDLSDLGQVGQDTLGGLAATLAGSGPGGLVGAAALAAGAVGLGLVTAELQHQQEVADETKRRLGAIYQDAMDAGRDYIDQSQFIAESNDLRFNPDRADEWKQLQADAKTLGLDVNDLIKANSGDLEAQGQVIDRVKKKQDDLAGAEKERLEGSPNAIAAQSRARQAEVNNLSDMRDRWTRINDTSKQYASNVTDAQRSTDQFLRETINSSSRATEQVDDLGNKLYTLPDGSKVLIEADTGLATQNLDKFKGDSDEVDKIIMNPTVKVTVDSSAWDDWQPFTKIGQVFYKPRYDLQEGP